MNRATAKAAVDRAAESALEHLFFAHQQNQHHDQTRAGIKKLLQDVTAFKAIIDEEIADG